MSEAKQVLKELEQHGVVVLPKLMDAASLAAMQQHFDQALKHSSFNTWWGYEQNERWRRLVEHCLRLHPGFVNLALNPLVMEVLGGYLGEDFVLTEARGWETVATKRNFHGWHNDAWYDTDLPEVPRQIKLGIYLSDVESGQFRYVDGSHRPALRPGHWNDQQVAEMPAPVIDVFGKAGTAFLFDTAGVHRQSSPVLKARNVVFFNYHDPTTPLMGSETAYGRYDPPLLNVACLPVLSEKQQAVLGIGRVDLPEPFDKKRRYPVLHSFVQLLLKLRLRWQDGMDQWARVERLLKRLLGKK